MVTVRRELCATEMDRMEALICSIVAVAVDFDSVAVTVGTVASVVYLKEFKKK